jgi:hypothetical protein
MKNDGRDGCRVTGVSRRSFLAHIGASAIGFLVAPGLRAGARYAGTAGGSSAFLAQVAITQNDNYLRTVIRQKVEHLFDSIGGIADVVRAGDKVAVKINLTGGSGSAASPRLGALPITESMWTHPEVVRAVGELMIPVLTVTTFFLWKRCGIRPPSWISGTRRSASRWGRRG